MMALGPLALKHIVDSLDARSSSSRSAIAWLVVLYVASQWTARSIGEARALVYAYAERRMFRMLSEKVFSHVMRLPLRFHLQKQTGGVNQTLQNGLQGYQTVIHHSVFTLLPVVAEFATIVVVLVSLRQPVFLAYFAAACAAYAGVFAVSTARVKKVAEAAAERSIDATAIMTDSILNYETVKYFTAEEVVQKRFGHALLATEREWLGFYRTYAFGGLVVAAMYALFLGVTVAYAAHQVETGAITLGAFVLINSYMLQAIGPIEAVGYAVQGLSQGAAMLANLAALLDEKTESDEYGSNDERTEPGSLRFDGVSVGYSSHRMVLNNVTFTIAAGRTLGIVGESGAGKSTLVRLMTRLVEPETGTIYLDGVPVTCLPPNVVRKAIAVVPQDTILLCDTIANNISLGRPGCSRDEIERAARAAQLHDFITKLPQGYDTPVGERGTRLSGGERQRVSIARAVLKRPRMYVFDEATSSLDSSTERQIALSLQQVSRARTTMIIAHRLSTVVHADEILVLDSGTVVERGTHATLLERNGRYASLWRAQQVAGRPHQVSPSVIA